MGLFKFFSKNSTKSSSISKEITEKEIKEEVEEEIPQRREYVRVDKCCPITCHIINRDGKEIDGNISCETVNIGGGGLKILTTTGLFRLADILDCSLFIDNEVISFTMKIIRSCDAKCTLKTYGCQFVNITNSQRDFLLNLIFHELLKQRNTIGTN